MKENEGKVNRRKRLYLCLVTVLFCCIMYFCHSCTPPDAVYAAESEMNDPVSTELTEVPVEGTMKYVMCRLVFRMSWKDSKVLRKQQSLLCMMSTQRVSMKEN